MGDASQNLSISFSLQLARFQRAAIKNYAPASALDPSQLFSRLTPGRNFVGIVARKKAAYAKLPRSIRFIDVSATMSRYVMAGRSSPLKLPGGSHLSEEGYALVARALEPQVMSALRR